MLYQILFGTTRPQACTVHERPDPAADRMDRAEALRFVKDGFSFPAFLLGPLWLLAHRLWIAFAGYLVLLALILLVAIYFDLSDFVVLALVAAGHVVIGFEADAVERTELEHKGWSTVGSVVGASAQDCERRFLDIWLRDQPILASATTSATPPAIAPRPATSVPTAASQPTTDGTVAGRLAALWRRKG